MFEVKEHLTTVWENLNLAQLEHLSSIGTLLKTLCLSDECDQFKVISLDSSSFTSSSKLIICVIVLVPKCLSISSFSSKPSFIVLVLVVPKYKIMLTLTLLMYAWQCYFELKQIGCFCIAKFLVRCCHQISNFSFPL